MLRSFADGRLFGSVTGSVTGTGGLRVLALHPHSATCLVTQSVHEIELGDAAVARKGY